MLVTTTAAIYAQATSPACGSSAPQRHARRLARDPRLRVVGKRATDGRVFMWTLWCANAGIYAILTTFCAWQHTFEAFFCPETNILCLVTHV